MGDIESENNKKEDKIKIFQKFGISTEFLHKSMLN